MRSPLMFCSTAVVVLLVFVACGRSSNERTDVPAQPTATSESGVEALNGMTVTIGDTTALLWGEGENGVILFHGAIYDAASWTEQAREIANAGQVALALERLSLENVAAAVEFLLDERHVSRIAVIGSSAGTGPAIYAARTFPDIVSQLIVISGSGDVTELGPLPKLFVASEGESGAVRSAARMVDEAAGDANSVLILPGSAHGQAIFNTEQGSVLMQSIVDQLAKYDE